MTDNQVSAIVDSPLGKVLLEGHAEGLTKVQFVAGNSAPTSALPEELQDGAIQLQEYFKGERRQFDLLLAPDGTDFQKQIWDLLQHIPYGKTESYLTLSKRYGDEKAIRAIAAANGRNPLAIVIPCHRVIGSDGSLTGYAGGLSRKQWLLDHESPAQQMRLF
ncbi:methylated-DNA--[protein]-cysteine S-methyltransferase [Croceiramulus getboli]|nr:methylated-DNA--[protein]-cysteine S-methyltransferase [Flavobacteriaceae bacterium YJPT1-3]